MIQKSDVLVIGAGPAGASAAILLARAGWRVTLVEQYAYPRQKVCGECIAAGNFALLDQLGVGAAVRRLSGAALERVAWMHSDATVTAEMPACLDETDRYGRALGRDVLDSLLLERALAVGVRIVQPAKVRRVAGVPGNFRCDIEHIDRARLDRARESASQPRFTTIGASILIDAHGSWESGPHIEAAGEDTLRLRQRASDLFAFKATFLGSALKPGLLPVLAFKGGYGGLVVANEGRTTVACCVRRDTLRALRSRRNGLSAGVAVESYLRESCQGLRDALTNAQRAGSWLTVGPLRPGIRLNELPGVFRVGNAAGETHPLIGEGISLALQSSALLVESLVAHADCLSNPNALRTVHQTYSRAWRKAFLPRQRLAAVYAHVAMRAPLAVTVGTCLRAWPTLLSTAALVAGKARPAVSSTPLSEEPS